MKAIGFDTRASIGLDGVVTLVGTDIPDNQTYYFRLGVGEWCGRFTLSIDDWGKFWRTRIGFWNRALTLGMVLIGKVLGPSKIVSTLHAPEWGSAGVV